MAWLAVRHGKPRREWCELPGTVGRPRAPGARVTGSDVTIGAHSDHSRTAFAVPHTDNRLIVTRNGRTSEEVLGDQTSYTYQLARLAGAPHGGPPFPAGIDGSVANAELIDECYRRAGLSPRAT